MVDEEAVASPSPRPGPRRRRATNQIVVIFWRDIPAQVNAQVGDDRHQFLMGERFQRAIDQAKRKAKIFTADEDVSQWRRETRPLNGDPTVEGQRVVDELDTAYPHARLRAIILDGGHETTPDQPSRGASPAPSGAATAAPGPKQGAKLQ